jgi:uncharacterized C2H2 Zn-finger protein
MTAAKLKCPECQKPFTTVQMMSMHRRQAHGVVGMSKGAIQEREKRAAAREGSSTPLPPAPLTHPCPQCARAFTSANGLAKHRSKAHGVVGQSKSARDRAARKAKQASATPLPVVFRCEQCDFTAKNQGGLKHHVTTIHLKPNHPVIKKVRSTALAPSHEDHAPAHARNGHAQRQALGDGIPEATLALALGRWQGLIQSMAGEFDLPPKRFAAQLAALIYATAVR